MIENFLQYGQWVVLVLSILSLYLVSSVNHETRLNGYILTGISRFAGASIFIFVDICEEFCVVDLEIFVVLAFFEVFPGVCAYFLRFVIYFNSI